MRFNLYAVYGLARGFERGGADDENFDAAQLPFDIADGVRLEDISAFIQPDTFALVERRMGTDAVEELRNVRYALIHRYDPHFIVDRETGQIVGEAQHDATSKQLVRNLAACLRLIRPMRQSTESMHGTVRDDGMLDVMGFDHPLELLETPQNQKLFTVRNRDANDLRALGPAFLQAMRGQAWKFRMAVQFHELGHYQDSDWKARYLLWASAIESIYTSHDREHKGSLVARERIKWFLGENTTIYPAGELVSLLADPHLAVGRVIEDLYVVRNFIAHGDRVPDRYFQETWRAGLNGGVKAIEVLIEAASFIVRHSLLKVLRQGLLAHFEDAPQAEAYFAAQGLTLTEIRRRMRP